MVRYVLENRAKSLIKDPQFIGAHIDIDEGGDIDGVTVSTGKERLIIKTKRAVAGKRIFFFPLIKWNNDGVWDLCAAIDPKIVNV